MIDDILDVLGLASDAADAADAASTAADAIEATMTAADMTDLSELSDLADIGHATDLADLTDLADVSDAADVSGVKELSGESHFVDSLNDGYNVSFKSQKATLESVGGIKLDATIDKEPGTANRFCIKTWKGTVHDVPGGTHSVKINGIVYKLPKLIG